MQTSNEGKQNEYTRLFLQAGKEIAFSETDVAEIDADPLSVIRHKAGHVPEQVLVEDTVLEVEGEEAGIHIRWLLEKLPTWVGRKAVWKVYLAYRKEGTVRIYIGEVEGVIAERKGEQGFGFDPYFQPEGKQKTLAEEKPDDVNARALAVHRLLSGKPADVTTTPLTDWEGPWQ